MLTSLEACDRRTGAVVPASLGLPVLGGRCLPSRSSKNHKDPQGRSRQSAPRGDLGKRNLPPFDRKACAMKKCRPLYDFLALETKATYPASSRVRRMPPYGRDLREGKSRSSRPPLIGHRNPWHPWASELHRAIASKQESQPATDSRLRRFFTTETPRHEEAGRKNERGTGAYPPALALCPLSLCPSPPSAMSSSCLCVFVVHSFAAERYWRPRSRILYAMALRSFRGTHLNSVIR